MILFVLFSLSHLCLFFNQPERLRDEEIDRLEEQLRIQALGPAPQSAVITQEEPSVPSNCFKFQNKVFGESRFFLFCLFIYSSAV